MPVVILKQAIREKLKNIDFKKLSSFKKPTTNDIFKEILISGYGIDVEAKGDNGFEVIIPEQKYFKALASSFWFSMQKVREQRKVLEFNNSKNLPLAWLLVSAYYSCFYSAVELSRLFGNYNMSLNKQQCDLIVSQTSSQFELQPGVFDGKVNFESTNYISVYFRRIENSKPHELAWRNMLEILKSKNKQTLLDQKVEKFKLLEEIFDSSKKRYMLTPNNVRNNWNYSFANAYDIDFCAEVQDLFNFVGENRGGIIKWSKNWKKLNNKQNDAYSIFFLEVILAQVMEDMEQIMYDTV